MLKSRSREKLLHAINYFAYNTKYCGKVKLYKLLYFLDFQHYMEVGRSVTSLEYFAWPKGPVPVELQNEFLDPKPDMQAVMHVTEKPVARGKNKMLKIEPLADFDEDLFTKRELKILANLALEYRGAKAQDMIERTHLENLPWHRIYEQEGRRQELIPYEYALKKGDQEQAVEAAKDHEEFERNYM